MIQVPLTQLQIDLMSVQAASDKAARALEDACKRLNEAHAALWSLPKERLEALLNHMGLAQVQGVFSAHQQIAVQSNTALDAWEHQGARAIIVPGKHMTYDGTFHILEVETEPEPEVVP